MSLEVKGAYAIVLDLIYMRDGRLPDDARFIAGQLGCSVRKWSAIRDELIARGKLTVELGLISNFRANYLLEETRKYRDKQAEIATKPRQINRIRQPEPSQSEPEEDKSSVAKATDAKGVDLNAEAWRLAVAVLTSQGGLTEPKARAFFGRLLKGITAGDMLPAVSQAALAKTQDPQGYLTAAADRFRQRGPSLALPQKRVGFV